MGECHVKVQAEFGMMPLETKECQTLPADDQKIGKRCRADSPHSPQKEPVLLTP